MIEYIKKPRVIISNNINFNSIIRSLLFLIPLISIILKSIIFQGFILNDDPYKLDLAIAINSSKYFLTYYFSFTLLLLSFSLLFKSKGRVIYLFILDIIITALILLDLGYFRGFLTLPSALLLTQTANLDNMGGTISSMFSSIDFLFLIDFIIFPIFIFFFRKPILKTKKRASITFFILIILSLVCIFFIYLSTFIY